MDTLHILTLMLVWILAYYIPIQITIHILPHSIRTRASRIITIKWWIAFKTQNIRPLQISICTLLIQLPIAIQIIQFLPIQMFTIIRFQNQYSQLPITLSLKIIMVDLTILLITTVLIIVILTAIQIISAIILQTIHPQYQNRIILHPIIYLIWFNHLFLN